MQPNCARRRRNKYDAGEGGTRVRMRFGGVQTDRHGRAAIGSRARDGGRVLLDQRIAKPNSGPPRTIVVTKQAQSGTADECCGSCWTRRNPDLWRVASERAGQPSSKIGPQFGISCRQVRKIVRGRAWQHAAPETVITRADILRNDPRDGRRLAATELREASK